MTVLRYIEMNPVRARMVDDPTAHRWSSVPAHAAGRPDPLLSPFPEWISLCPDEPSRQQVWRHKLQAPQSESELQAIRASLRSGLPFGAPEWAERLAALLRKTPPRPRGRPRKAEKMN